MQIYLEEVGKLLLICIGGKNVDKKQFQKLVKEKFKILGFQSRGNHHYKIVDGEYLIGASLAHRLYGKGYFIDYGIIYLPDEDKLPFKGNFDWCRKFWFTKDYSKELTRYQLDNLEECYQEMTDYFEYDQRSIDELNKALDLNIEKMLSVLSDKECAFKDYRKNLDIFVSLTNHEIKKFIKLGVVSKETVLRHRIARGYKDNSFLM